MSHGTYLSTYVMVFQNACQIFRKTFEWPLLNYKSESFLVNPTFIEPRSKFNLPIVFNVHRWLLKVPTWMCSK